MLPRPGIRRRIFTTAALAGCFSAAAAASGQQPRKPGAPLHLRLEYATYLGGREGEDGMRLALDGHGGVYFAGNTASPDFPVAGEGGHTRYSGGSGLKWSGGDVGAVKLNADGSAIEYGTFWGGAGDEYHSYFTTADRAGNVYIFGITLSRDFPTTEGAYDRSLGGERDVFILKLDPRGRVAWSTLLGGSGDESGAGLAVDGHGAVYVLVGSKSPEFPSTLPPLGRADSTPSGNRAGVFAVKLSPDGSNIVWSRRLGSIVDRQGGMSQIRTGPDGSVYVLGKGGPGDFTTTPGAFAAGARSASDVYVARIGADGKLMFGTYLGGSKDDDARSVRIAPDGSAAVAGLTASPDFPTTVGAWDRTFHGGSANPWGGDAFAAMLNPTGTRLLWSTLIGTTGDDSAELGGWLDGNPVVLVSSTHRELPATDSIAPQRAPAAYLAIFDPDARHLLYGAYVGPSTRGFATADVDERGHIWIAGATEAQDLMTAPHALQPRYGGGERDGFLMRFAVEGVGRP